MKGMFMSQQCKITNLNNDPSYKYLKVVHDHPDKTANPAPLGLFGFGLTTILTGLHLAGIFGDDSIILAMGIFYGGFAQIIAGVMEWKKNNTFGTTAFTSYGLFWLSFISIMVFPRLGLCEKPAVAALVSYLAAWGTFTFLLFIGTLRINRALQVTFAMATILFFGVALGDATAVHGVKVCFGYVGVLCGLCATYTAVAQVYNELYGKVLLPLGQSVY